MSKEPLDLVQRGDVAYRQRDYRAAQELYEEALRIAKVQGKETNYIYSSLVRVYKHNRLYLEAVELARQAMPTPAGFRDAAICLRAVAKEGLARKDPSQVERALDELYRMAVLAAVCYGDHDCKSAVSGQQYERALLIVKALPLRSIGHCYRDRGVIKGGLLGGSDYRLFEKVFGASPGIFDPQMEYSELLKSVDQEVQREEARRLAALNRLFGQGPET